MDSIVEFCMEQQLRAGYFAVLYRFVTIRIKEEIEAGNFNNNQRMEKLDIIFAQRFFDAFNGNFFENTPCTQSWLKAFNAAGSESFISMQHLLLGINAHINLDLGIAAAETMKDGDLDDIYPDYLKVNAILGSLVDEVSENIGKISPFFRIMMRLTRSREEMLVNFSIVTARDGAWQFAHRYAAYSNKSQAIEERDQKIALLAGRLTDTGKWLSFLIKIIRIGEFRTPARNMEILSGVISR